jgi:arylsulfatase A-like enzyme
MARRKPNILWICTDSQRWDTLGCYGNRFVHSPNLDRLAGESVLFNHCYSVSPVCTPSRGVFLTGRYPAATKLRQNGQNVPPDTKLVTRILADGGYVCGLAGKMHLCAADFRVLNGTEPRIDDGYSVFKWAHGKSDRYPTSAYTLWLREQSVKLERKPFPGSDYVRLDVPARYSQTAFCAETAIHFIESFAESETPWLFSVNPVDPHFDFVPSESYLHPYLDRLDDIPLPNYIEGELEDKPLFQKLNHKSANNSARPRYPYDEMSEREHRLCRAAYWAMCDLIDAQVGRMLEALDRTGQRENTIVIFCSDHGELLGDHGIYLKGPFFYDPAIRVPLIVHWPGVISGGRQSDALVELTDLAPMLLQAAGLDVDPGMQGQSIWPLLTGKAEIDVHREDVYCEYHNAMCSHQDPKAYCSMVRTHRHKLVRVHGRDEGELYDLDRDPTENHNLWHDPGHTQVKMEMLLRLSDRLCWTDDPLPKRMGIF